MSRPSIRRQKAQFLVCFRYNDQDHWKPWWASHKFTMMEASEKAEQLRNVDPTRQFKAMHCNALQDHHEA